MRKNVNKYFQCFICKNSQRKNLFNFLQELLRNAVSKLKVNTKGKINMNLTNMGSDTVLNIQLVLMNLRVTHDITN